LASRRETSDQSPMEGLTRALSIGATTVSILAAGLVLDPAPRTTALESAQASAQADPFGLQSGGDGHSLPTQKTKDILWCLLRNGTWSAKAVARSNWAFRPH